MGISLNAHVRCLLLPSLCAFYVRFSTAPEGLCGRLSRQLIPAGHFRSEQRWRRRFHNKSERVVEIVRGVGGVMERGIVDGHFREGGASYQLSPLKWAPRRSCSMLWLVRSARLLVWGWYAVEAMQ